MPLDEPPDPARLLVERVYSAVAAGDRDAVRSLLSDQLRWRQAGSQVPAAGEERTGADALIREVIDPLEQEWDDFRESVDALVDAHDTVVSTGTYLATHRRTGRALRAEFCHIWTIEQGRVTAFRQYTDTAAFAVSAGEDAAS